jgi:uncharacterized protein (DUF1800 family)
MVLSRQVARNARIAFQRFGMGPKPGGPVSLGNSATAAYDALVAELNDPSAALITDPTLPSYAKSAATALIDRTHAGAQYFLELNARVAQAKKPKVGFVERLALFWSNHFSVSMSKSQIDMGMVGHLERAVIRPNTLGKFSDMHLAVLQHPAMIDFLDNTESVGPGSPYGAAFKLSFNENLARETLELHTLGFGAGYTQADVDQLSRALSGWSYVRGWEANMGRNGGNSSNIGQFIYRDGWHQPGRCEILGKSYPQKGEAQLIAILKDLDAHPATAEHIAYKLVCHFITDIPTPDMVNPVAQAFLDSGGDLKATAQALIDLPAAWSAPMTKLRTPYEWWMGIMRAYGVPALPSAKYWILSEPLLWLNQQTWSRETPDGFPDLTFNWLNPADLYSRSAIAQLAFYLFASSGSQYNGLQAIPLASSLFDSDLSAASVEALTIFNDEMRRVPTLLMLPEFLRR